jgi:hypothetical protein
MRYRPLKREASSCPATLRRIMLSTAFQEHRNKLAMWSYPPAEAAKPPHLRSPGNAKPRAGPTAPPWSPPARNAGSPVGGYRLPVTAGSHQRQRGAIAVSSCHSGPGSTLPLVQISRRARCRISTTIPAGSKRTPITVALGRANIRLNAELTRTGASWARLFLADPGPSKASIPFHVHGPSTQTEPPPAEPSHPTPRTTTTPCALESYIRSLPRLDFGS